MGAMLGLAEARPPKPLQKTSWASQKKTPRVKGLNMAYYDTGGGDPIVFLHGNLHRPIYGVTSFHTCCLSGGVSPRT
jgi:hypothetical protein